MSCGGEPGHVRAGLGGDHVGRGRPDARDRADQFPETAKGLDHHLDPFGELVDGRGVLVEQGQVHPGQERVVVGEPTSQRLDQLWCLGAQPTLSQIGQHGGVALPVDQGLEHRPTGDPDDVGGHRGQLDAGVLEQLLQPLHLPRAFAGDRGPGAGQVP